MSFRFGEFDTADVPGVLATLTAWPGLALTPETVDKLDGAFYARTRLGGVAFTFDVLLSARTPEEVHTLRDRFVAGCSPTVGLQALTPETGEGWVWYASVSEYSDFTRRLWVKGVECQLRASVSFLVPDGVGWAVPDETAAGATSVTLARKLGNLPSFPTVTIEGALPKGVRLMVDGVAFVDVTTPVSAGQRLVLDYQKVEFAVWAGAVKVAHAAGGMSTFARLSLPLGQTVLSATPIGSGSVQSVTVAANSRRG